MMDDFAMQRIYDIAMSNAAQSRSFIRTGPRRGDAIDTGTRINIFSPPRLQKKEECGIGVGFSASPVAFISLKQIFPH